MESEQIFKNIPESRLGLCFSEPSHNNPHKELITHEYCNTGYKIDVSIGSPGYSCFVAEILI